MRLSPSWRSKAELAWAFTVAELLSRHVPDVIAPMSSKAGTSVVLWGERPVSVWPYVEGLLLDRDNARQRRDAARVLAALHRAAPFYRPGSQSAAAEPYSRVK